MCETLYIVGFVESTDLTEVISASMPTADGLSNLINKIFTLPYFLFTTTDVLECEAFDHAVYSAIFLNCLSIFLVCYADLTLSSFTTSSINCYFSNNICPLFDYHASN